MAPIKPNDLPFAPGTGVPAFASDFVPIVPASAAYPTALAALDAIDCPPILVRALLTALDTDPCAMVDVPTFVAEGGALPSSGPWRQTDPAHTLLAIVQMPDGRYFLGVGSGALSTSNEAHSDEIAAALTQAIGRPVLTVRRTHLAMAAHGSSIQ